MCICDGFKLCDFLTHAWDYVMACKLRVGYVVSEWDHMMVCKLCAGCVVFGAGWD